MTDNEIALMANIAVDMQDEKVNEVLAKIRVEIIKQSRTHMDGDLYIKASECMQIIDKYIEEDKA